MKYALCTLLLAFVLLAPPALAAEPVAAPAVEVEKEKPLSTKEVTLVEVRKRQRRMFLLDDENNVVRTYHIALGRNPVGPKQQEGDSRTPEGKYTIDSRNGKSGYYRSLHISYPNAEDIKRAKAKKVSPGGAIFIHGKPSFKFWMFWKYNKMNDWTDGCIAVDDKDMMEMWGLVKAGTAIHIKP